MRGTMSYQQLTEGKRYQIAALIAQGLRPSEVARIIHVHRSTIYRELRVPRKTRFSMFRRKMMAMKINELQWIICVWFEFLEVPLKRNGRGLSYEPTKAHDLALQRRHSSARYRVPQDTIDLIEVTLLLMEWSPEQISGVCRLIGIPVSHEWIY